MGKKNIEVCFSPLSFPLFKNESSVVVVIDVLRATSAICTALFHGVEKIIPVATIEEAKALELKGCIAAGERNGEMLKGFSLGNSPFSYMDEKLRGKTIALTTTNGTQALDIAKGSYQTVVGSFLNLTFLSKWLSEQNTDIILLCAGWKNKFNLEDSLFAGAVAANLIASEKFETNCDSTLASMRLYQSAKQDLHLYLKDSSHRNRLSKLDLEKDIRYCLTPDQCPVIPVLKEDALERMKL